MFEVPVELVDTIVAAERTKAQADAAAMTAMAALHDWVGGWLTDADRRHGANETEVAAAEIAAAVHLTLATAAIRVDRAVRIRDRLPAALAGLARGELDLGRVLAMDDATMALSDADAARVSETVIAKAVHQTAGELRAALRKAVLAVDPDAAERRRKLAIKGRAVRRWTRDDGTGAIEAVLSAIDSGEIYDLVDETARQMKTDGDTRSIDARRADAFVMIMLGRDPHLGPQDDDEPPLPTEPRDPDDAPADPRDDDVRPDPAGTDEPSPARTTPQTGAGGRVEDVPVPDEPDDLDERFPPPPPVDTVPAPPTRSERLRELAALALSGMRHRSPGRLPWVAIAATVDPDGRVIYVGELQGCGAITSEYAQHLLDIGAARPPPAPSRRVPTRDQAARHDPPGWLDRDVRTRDGSCRAPGCRSPAHRADLDHSVPFPGGPTVAENLGALCRRHHRVKTIGAWDLRQHPDGAGTLTWTSRLTGRRYRTTPRGTTGDWTGAEQIS